MSESLSWSCPTCSKTVTSPFCAACGEAPPCPRDLTLRGLAERVAHAFTSIDARAVRTARCLVGKPGQLTLAWTRGVRKPYVGPFQLFLIANVIFFTVQGLTGEVVFGSPLNSHLHHQDWSELAQSLLAGRLEATHLSVDQYAPLFDRAVELNSKSLILLMTIPFALLLPLVFLRERRPFMVHVVFALHLYAFLLLVFCAALLAAKASALLGFGGLQSPLVDDVLSIANLAACIVYVHLAIGPVYATTGVVRALQSIVLAFSVAAIVLGYRFALFLITLYAT